MVQKVSNESKLQQKTYNVTIHKTKRPITTQKYRSDEVSVQVKLEATKRKLMRVINNLRMMHSTWGELWCKHCRPRSSKFCRGRQASGTYQGCGTGPDVSLLRWKCPHTFRDKVGKHLFLRQGYVHACMETLFTRGRVQPGPPSC